MLSENQQFKKTLEFGREPPLHATCMPGELALSRMKLSFLVPLVLFAAALAVFAVGLRFSRRFLRRGRYLTGLTLISVSLFVFWPIQVMISAWVERWGIYGAPAILPFLLSVALFASGLALISKANNTPRDDYYDSLLS
jgi:hypothetical protein